MAESGRSKKVLLGLTDGGISLLEGTLILGRIIASRL